MQRLAVLADTHGRVPEAVAALAVLDAHAPDLFVHCGDVGGGRYSAHGVLNELARVAGDRPVYLVPGNNDRDPAALETAADERGLHYGDPALIELNGVRICVTHGTKWEQDDFAERGVDGVYYDLICSGHTHRRAWERKTFPNRTEDGPAGERSVHLLNPGACWRADPRSVALLDLPSPDPATWKRTFLDVPRP
ncbi:metallophosphoesterase family protein [Alienimonas chondri]|uniref:Calcineurin-like phosphoesterase domain-containing protein n=1 Tax=Alienimonas chondri TaxID=2681879 RepID=A0ABX1VHH9_9PLAN|nr:metallophosphoesterase family protein [Alienimonas chondri]NNJ27259.1 hypothetical protein [Alienimonas chondri]